MLLFCKCQGKLTYHQTAEIQVAVGSVVIKDVTYCKKYPQEDEWRIARYGRGCQWKIFDSSLPRKETMSTV